MSVPNDRRRPRWPAIAFAVLLGAIVAVTSQPPAGTAAGTILFGANPGLDEAGSRLAPLNDLEADLGRDLDLVRVFERWDAQWDTPFHDAVEAGDTVMLLSVKAKRENNTNLLWNDIANAAVGSAIYNDIQMWIDRVENFDGEVWFTFHHEPEASVSEVHGNNTDFIAAWKRVVDEFRARGVGNVQFAWVMTYWSFATDPDDDGHADQWYPGDAYVDLIGSDAYNWDFCKGGTTDPWRSLEHQIEPQRQYGLDHPDKGLILAEWASNEAGDGGAAKSRWIADAAALFKQPGWEQFVGLTYFNIIANENHLECNWLLDSSESAKAAFVAMGADPFYGSPFTLECDGRLATMVGTTGRDVLLGSPESDVIVARGGSDSLTGGGGADAICGGYGNDVISGGPGSDFLAGSFGNDTISGGGGPDVIYGGHDDDELLGYGGDDILDGGPGHDVAWGHDGLDSLYGKAGADRLEGGNDPDGLHGGTGTDVVAGGGGGDNVIGGGGSDTLYGGYGSDTLYGWGGGDALYGGPANDVLNGGAGVDTCVGGAGSDSFDSC